MPLHPLSICLIIKAGEISVKSEDLVFGDKWAVKRMLYESGR